MTNPNNDDGIQLVVGIDFGTSYSAYAYSYAYEKDKIFINSDWPSGSKAYKEATAILFDENRSFVVFGERAIEKHGDLSNVQEKTWYFSTVLLKWLYTKNRLVSLYCLSKKKYFNLNALLISFGINKASIAH